jgi:hypothetical protein
LAVVDHFQPPGVHNGVIFARGTRCGPPRAPTPWR